MSAITWLGYFWTWIRDIVMVLRPCRFSAAVILGGALLITAPQGTELTVRLPDQPFVNSVWFHVAVFLWALQSWFWARELLDVTFGESRKIPESHPRKQRIEWWLQHTPRILALLAYGVATAASALTGWSSLRITLALAVAGVVFYYALVRRRAWVAALLPKSPEWTKRWLVPRSDQHGLRALPRLARAFLYVSLGLAAVLTAWVWVDAPGFAWAFGGAAVPFIGFAMIVPVGSLLVYFFRQVQVEGPAAQALGLDDSTRGYPVVIPLLLIAILWNLVPAFDNHAVRAVGGPPTRDELGKFIAAWQVQAADGAARPIIVATAGGGLRAAYWTATVLGRIQDEAPQFRKRLFAISGVSGGSLGGTVFVTLLGQEERALKTAADQCDAADRLAGVDPARTYECAGQLVLSRDFLGPTVAALLFTDLLQRFVPIGFPDRAQALEEAWERAWLNIGFKESPWSTDFQKLWEGKGPLPALFLNGTHVETGKRVITSNVRIVRDPFTDAHDFFDLAAIGIRPSTAAHNSARFTYVSPAGTLKYRKDGKWVGSGTHLVDGGYFENFGAVTAAQALRAYLMRPPAGEKVKPIVILISNDPRLEESDFPLIPQDKPRQVDPKFLLAEVLSPLRAMLETRNGRGLLAIGELRDDVKAAGGDYFQFRLCKDAEKGRPDPALGWVLSRRSEALMREQLRTDACGNKKEFERLMAELGAPAAPRPATGD